MPPYIAPKGIKEEELLSESTAVSTPTSSQQNGADGITSPTSSSASGTRPSVGTAARGPALRPPASSNTAETTVTSPNSAASASRSPQPATNTANRPVQLVARLGPLNGPRAAAAEAAALAA